VNWCGHKYGYVNFKDTGDRSRNSIPFDFLTLGELFQNNHHKFPSRTNFAVRFFEVDPTYPFIKLLTWMRVIRLSNPRAISSQQ
jgi:stearoyl-CoA desaturase (Delta-9 desaturase)